MKKYIAYIFFALIVGTSFTSCLDNNDEEYEEYLELLEAYQKRLYEQYLTDSLLIVDYLAENDSVAEFHEFSGIFYNIIQPGGDIHPNYYSSINVMYKGMLIDGTVFEQTEIGQSVQFYLGNLIAGWQVGVPLIGAEGKIILYLPSYWGYGEFEKDEIPANSVLIYEIELLNFY